MFGDKERYFFTPRDRKYPNGTRPNRAAGSGYWKATGTDKVIQTSGLQKESIGVKKALVFYKGRPPKGAKTNWIMNEYRLLGSPTANDVRQQSRHLDSMRVSVLQLENSLRLGFITCLILPFTARRLGTLPDI